MIDGNISMEEDTELRDLVVQTLENNGVIAKVRAELRASVFLALEEQESVMNPEPLLNKTVKQYLANSEGKLLFSLVREFLEYFGLDYTISVYDPETYSGKEYNYVGRNKLCEELGIDTNEPLLGEILKNSMNSAFNNTKNNETNNSRHAKADETSTGVGNATFEVSVPKVVHNENLSLSNENDLSDKLESVSQQSPKVPMNVTITDKRSKTIANSTLMEKTQNSILRDGATVSGHATDHQDGIDNSPGNNNDKHPTTNQHSTPDQTEPVYNNQTSILNKTEPLIKFDDTLADEVHTNQNQDIGSKQQNSINNSMEMQIANNVQNKKPVTNTTGTTTTTTTTTTTFGKTVYFEQIIVDGKKQNVNAINKTDTFLEDLPPIDQKSNSIFGDLPPLNGKKTNINDIKELMDIGLGTDALDNYDEDFVSSASGSANDQSPSKDPDKPHSPPGKQQQQQPRKQERMISEDISEEIEEMDDILSSASCVSKSDMD